MLKKYLAYITCNQIRGKKNFTCVMYTCSKKRKVANKYLKINLSRLLSHGFTLLEMLVTISIIAILTSLAIPSFSRYLKRAHYTEVVQAMTPFKLGVSECVQTTASLKGCSSGENGVPSDLTSTNKKNLVSNIKTKDGIITAVPKTSNGFTSKDTYILTPTDDDDTLTWDSSGGAVDAGYCH